MMKTTRAKEAAKKMLREVMKNAREIFDAVNFYLVVNWQTEKERGL